MGWTIVRGGVTETLPTDWRVNLDPSSTPNALQVYDARDGAYVDTARGRLQPRGVILRGLVREASTGDTRILNNYNRLAYWERFLRGEIAVSSLVSLRPTWDTTRELRVRFEEVTRTPGADDDGAEVFFTLEARGEAVDGCFRAVTETTVSKSIAGATTSDTVAAVVGSDLGSSKYTGWPVWPKITLAATVAGVVNPKVALPDGRYVQYQATLAAGETLVLDPEALTALIGSTGVLDKIVGGWFDPDDRFALNPGSNTVTLSKTDTAGTLALTLAYRNRWV